MIKWNGGIEAQTEGQIKKAVEKVLASKAVYLLAILTAFMVVSSAIEKFVE